MNYQKRCVCIVAMSLMAAAASGADVEIQKDLVYATHQAPDGTTVELEYDIAVPPEGTGPFPLIVCVHAGGWQLGDKKSYRKDLNELAPKGYVAATINYRKPPTFKWPAQAQDVRQAVRFFRENAAKYNIDPKRVGLVGDDAGGHLSLMAAMMAANEEKGVPIEKSSKVLAVVNFFGPPDLRDAKVTSNWVATQVFVGFGKNFEGVMADFLGTSDKNAPVFLEASPFTHVSKESPPILSVIGTEDPLLGVGCFKQFHQLLREQGVAEELLIVEGAKHHYDSIDSLGGSVTRMHEFFDKHVKGTASN